MRLMIVTGLIALIVSTSVNPVHAQRRGQGPGQSLGGFRGGPGGLGGSPPSMADLLQIPVVQNDLKLSDEQRARVESIAQEKRNTFRERMQQAAGGNVVRPTREQLEQLRESMNEQAQQALGKILDVDQRSRANQIFYQALGSRVFGNDQFAKKLKLSREQTGQVRQILGAVDEELRASMRNTFGAGQPGQAGQRGGRRGQGRGRVDFQAISAKRQELETQATERLMELLSDEQKETYRSLLGTPIQLPAPGRGGFGGGRGPGGQRDPG